MPFDRETPTARHWPASLCAGSTRASGSTWPGRAMGRRAKGKGGNLPDVASPVRPGLGTGLGFKAFEGTLGTDDLTCPSRWAPAGPTLCAHPTVRVSRERADARRRRRGGGVGEQRRVTSPTRVGAIVIAHDLRPPRRAGDLSFEPLRRRRSLLDHSAGLRSEPFLGLHARTRRDALWTTG